MNRMDQIPVIHDVDVVVAGGSSAAVSAAVAAAGQGARVFLGAMETYLGEDICGTARLWLEPTREEVPPLVREMFGENAGQTLIAARPMQVKEALDRALIEANVTFLFGCYPADLLRDEDGALAGLVFATRSGLVGVRAKTVIDATPRALAARMAGLEFRPWQASTLRCERIVVGHAAEDAGDAVVEELPIPLTVTIQDKEGSHEESFAAWRYTFDLPAPDGSPASYAEIEQIARDRTWHRDQVWTSDRCFSLPLDPLVGRAHVAGGWPGAAQLDLACCQGSEDRLWVLSGCIDLARDAATALLEPSAFVALGTRLGEAVAKAAAGLSVGDDLALASTIGHHECDVREPMRMERYTDDSLPMVSNCNRQLPVLGEVDVVVAGGGTGGAPAGIAAASEGARTIVIEYLNGFGGVGTMGLISIYYHGYREGFTTTVDEGVAELGQTGTPKKGRWNPEHKSEWLRRELRRHGGHAWYGCIATGAVMAGDKLRGIVVATPWGYGIIHAKVVLDCTGNADIAAAAGAPYTTTGADHIAIQGSGLPYRPIRPDYTNTDYTFIEDADVSDSSRAFVIGRRKFRHAFDMSQMVDTRERRQILGESWVTPLDVYAHRTWDDSIALGRSNYDTHGFTIHPLFLVKPPDRASIDALMPLGCFLPRGISGILVTGLALSAHRDVMPVLRMQADVQNHAYACGLAAVLALPHDGEIRAIDLQALRRRLADLEILPREALEQGDSFPLPVARVKEAVATELDDYHELAIILAHPDAALPHLQKAYAKAAEGPRRLALAKLLAIVGDARGVDTLIEAIREPWDEGWNYTGMGQFGRSLSPQDDCIVTLGLIKAAKALPVIREKAASLDAGSAFSHFRAIAIYAEQLGDASLAADLAALLDKPGIRGHAWTSLGDELLVIPPSHVDTTTRNVALRELILARSLYRCGKGNGVAKAILQDYARDIRGHFARHARAVLRG